MSLKEPSSEGQEGNKLSWVLKIDNSEKSLSTCLFTYLYLDISFILPVLFLQAFFPRKVLETWRGAPSILCEVEYHNHFMISQFLKAFPGYRAPGSEEPHSGSLRSWKSLGFYGLTLTYAILHLLAIYIPINIFTLRCGNCLIQTLTLEDSK